MASPQERNGNYRILFCHHGKLHTFTLGKVEKDEAENKSGKSITCSSRAKFGNWPERSRSLASPGLCATNAA
jgi:hypothetical protein